MKFITNYKTIPMTKLSNNLNLSQDFKPVTYEEWKKIAEIDLKGLPFEKKLITKTYEGIDLKPIYTDDDYRKSSTSGNMPGFYNFIRGTEASGYVDNKWLISQEMNYTDPDKLNSALLHDLNRGLNCINIVPDYFTISGTDPDGFIPENKNFSGASILSVNDFLRIFKDIDIRDYPIIINCGYSSVNMLALMIAYTIRKGIDFRKLNLKLLADPFEYSLLHGQIQGEFDSAFDDMAKILKWINSKKLNYRTIGISGLIYNNAGATAVQELAFIISSGIEYISQLLKRGLEIDDILKSIVLTLGIGSNYFTEIAKIRAARILWARIAESFGASEDAQKAFIHARTSVFNQTKYDPHVNMLRTTTEVFSAIIGSVDSIHANYFNECLSEPDDFARRIARNTQLILLEEAHLDSVIDPAGGSYFIECLTEEIALKSWELMQSVQKNGGMLKSIIDGFPQENVSEVANVKYADLCKRKMILVGTNMYANIKEEKPIIEKKDFKTLYESRIEESLSLKKSNKASFLKKNDTIDNVIRAFEYGASIFQVTKAVKKSEKTEINKIKTFRLAEPFEELRDLSFEYLEKNGSLPSVFLFAMGPLKQHKPRVDFSKGFFETGGFKVIYEKGFDSVSEATEKFISSGSGIAVICSTDETYPELVPEIVKSVKNQKSGTLFILAGYPKEQIEELRKNGIDDFIFLGADVYAVLKKIYNKILK